MTYHAHQSKRNVGIYVIGVLLLATLGGVITATVSEAGGLIFILSPLAMAVLLRFFGGDGWGDAGLSLKLQTNWHWYLFSLLIYPISFVVVIGLGMILGVTQFNGDVVALLPAFGAGFATQLIPRMIFALCEEWGWRGYLEPRLAALGVPNLQRHGLVGLIWAVWHVPLILSTHYTKLPYAIFFPIFVVGVVVAAVVYGQVRQASGTVWTAVLLHGIANAVAWAILQNNLVLINNKLLANIAPESILMIALWGALAGWMLFRRKA